MTSLSGRFHMLSRYSLFICPLETMFSVGGIQLPQEKTRLTNWHRQGLVCREGWISLAWQWARFYWHRRFVSSMWTYVPEVCRRSSHRSLNTQLGFYVGCSSSSGMSHYGAEFTRAIDSREQMGNLADRALKCLPVASYLTIYYFWFMLSLKFKIKCPETL